MKTLWFTFLLMALTTNAAERDSRCFEMRVYSAAPGKLDDLQARFRDHTCKIFEKHAMQNIGYWVPVENPDHKLIYVLGFPSREAREQSWKDFMADPEWKSVAKASEVNGRLVTKVDSTLLEATDYSPAIRPSVHSPDRVFELRTYTASAGNLGALDARFRDHTRALFTQHGMQNVAYWHVMAGQTGASKRADTTLVYILAHASREAADASFKAFRTDPKWIQVKDESEKKAGGSLTEGGMAGVKSEFMTPTDYSPIR